MGAPTVRPVSAVTAGLCPAAALVLAPPWAPLVLGFCFADLLRPAVRPLERVLGGCRRATGALVVLIVVGVLLPRISIALALASATQDLLLQVRAAMEGQGSLGSALLGGGVRRTPKALCELRRAQGREEQEEAGSRRPGYQAVRRGADWFSPRRALLWPHQLQPARCGQIPSVARTVRGEAMTLLHEARRVTRVDARGDLVLLQDQDRSRWDRRRIAEAQGLIDRALVAQQVGPFLLQAAIAAVHAEAPSADATDWAQIVGLYDTLLRVDPSEVVALNRAAALGMRDGPEAGLGAVEGVLTAGGLEGYYLAHAARADMQRRLGLFEAARASYERALELTRQPAERRFLQARLAQIAEFVKSSRPLSI